MTKLAEQDMQSPPRTDDPPNHVHIKNDRGHVNRDDVHISKSREEQVFWTHHGNKDAKIVFDTSDGSPFLRPEPYVVQPVERIASGPLHGNAVVGKRYKYTVIGADDRNDPGVIIDR